MIFQYMLKNILLKFAISTLRHTVTAVDIANYCKLLIVQGILKDNLSRDFLDIKCRISIYKQQLTLGVGSLPNSTAIV